MPVFKKYIEEKHGGPHYAGSRHKKIEKDKYKKRKTWSAMATEFDPDLDEGYEKTISLWMKDAFAGVDFHFKSGALHVPKGYRGKVARRMAVDKIKAPVGGIKEKLETEAKLKKKKNKDDREFAFGISRKGGSGAGRGYGKKGGGPVMMGDELPEATVLQMTDVDQWTTEIYKGIKAGWKSVAKSTLGGDENVAIMIKLTLEPEKEWPNKILHNASYGMIRIATDGAMEMFASGLGKGKNMRKTRVKSAKDVVTKINKWINTVSEETIGDQLDRIVEEAEMDEAKSKYDKQIAAFLKKGGKIKKLAVSKKEVAKAAAEFRKSHKNMTQKEIELDMEDELERQANAEGVIIADENLFLITEEISEKEYDSLKKGDIIALEYGSAMSGGKAKFKVTAKNVVNKGKVGKVTLKSVAKPNSVKFFLYKRGNKVSAAQGDMGINVKSFRIEQVEIVEKHNWAVIDTAPSAVDRKKNEIMAMSTDEKDAHSSIKYSEGPRGYQSGSGKSKKTLKVVRLKKKYEVGDVFKEEIEIEEGVTGPTRMEIQKFFDKQKGTQRARLNKTSQHFNIRDVIVNAKGTVVGYKMEEVEVQEKKKKSPVFKGTPRQIRQQMKDWKAKNDKLHIGEAKILKTGTKVKVAHPAKGKGMVTGKVVRYDDQGPGSPFYVVAIPGLRMSEKVPAHEIKEGDLSESQELQAKMALDDAGIKYKEKNNSIYIQKKDLKRAQKAFEKSFKKGGWPTLKVEEVLDEAADRNEVIEFKLFIENDPRMEKRIIPVVKNIQRKMAKGTYDHKKAPKLWMYVVKDAAKLYAKEFDGLTYGSDVHKEVAKQLADDYKAEIEAQDGKMYESKFYTDMEQLFEVLKSKDKSVIDAFYDKKPLEGRMLNTDGVSLDKVGMGGQEIARWKSGKIQIVAKMDVKSTEQIVNYMKKSIPKNNFEEFVGERDYRKEYDNYQGKPEQIARRSSRNQARRVMGDKAEEGKDVGHKDNNPMNNDPKNLRNEDPSKNRREPRLRKVESFSDYYNRPFVAESTRNDIYNGSIRAGVELEKYAKKSGGVDKDDLLATASILKKGKLPSAKQIPGDTDPRDKVFSIIGKHLSKQYLKKYKGLSPAMDKALKEHWELEERKLTDTEIKRREEIAQELDDAKFKEKYGDDWKSVKMGVATNMAKKEARESVEYVWFEARYKYKVDHKTYTSAVEEALIVADKSGYEVDMDDYFNQIATGPRKPQEGKTNIFKIALEKGGKEQKKKLQIQIYGKGKHGYELNCYIQ